MDTFEPSSDFDFSKVSLGSPQPVQGGSYFTKLSVGDDKQLCVQFPRCSTKQGVVTTKRGMYCDLLYQKDQQEELVAWTLDLENTCQKLIFEKRNAWFHTELTLEDIESMTSPVFRLYKAGRKLLIRTHIDTHRTTDKPKCLAYDENEVLVDLASLTPDKDIIPLVTIEGIKFSSKEFAIVTKLRQIMVLDGEAPEKAVCLIKRNNSSGPAVSDTKPDTGEQASEVSDLSELSDDVSQKEESSDSANVVLEVKNLDADTDQEKTLEEVIIEDPVDSPADSGSVASTASHASADNKEHSLEKLNSLEDLVEVVESGPKEEGLQEVDIQVDDSEPIHLKKPNEVYYEIYKAARKKAKTMRRAAIEAFLEARNIKTKFMLEDLDDSDDDDFGSDEEAFSQVSA